LPEKNEKTRLSVTMTKTYLEALDVLVEKGLFLSRGEAILEAVRDLLDGYGVEPFKKIPKEPE